MEIWILVLLILYGRFFAMRRMSINGKHADILTQRSQSFDRNDWYFNVVVMDKSRIDDIFARPIASAIPND